MNKKIYLIFALAVLLIVGLAQITIGQSDSYKLGSKLGAIEKDPFNKKVIAKVNGEDVTGWFFERQKLSLEMTTNKIPENQEVFDKVKRNFALYAEAKKRGYAISWDEAVKFSEQVKKDLALISEEERNKIQEEINAYGVSEDDYWTKIAPKGYYLLLPIGKLRADIYKNVPQDTLDQEAYKQKQKETFDAFADKLVKEAKIEIVDKSLKIK